MTLLLDIDVETSYEFIKEIYTHISPDFLQGLSKLMEEKSELFSCFLTNDSLEENIKELTTIYKNIFALKRYIKKWTEEQLEQMNSYVLDLLYANDTLEKRFDSFCELLKTNLHVTRPYEVASELLTYTNPSTYRLWANWIYNPDTENGSLKLVFTEGFTLNASSLGKLYTQVIDSQNKLIDMAVDLGISTALNPADNSIFDIPVFLCAVYAIYTFTVTKLRMTNEFNTILPKLGELLTRLLGVYYLHK